MITPQHLEILRCPIDPKRETKLILEEDVRLMCARCRVRFRVRDGLPSLVIEDATLPDGCQRIEDLPCRRG